MIEGIYVHRTIRDGYEIGYIDDLGRIRITSRETYRDAIERACELARVSVRVDCCLIPQRRLRAAA